MIDRTAVLTSGGTTPPPQAKRASQDTKGMKLFKGKRESWVCCKPHAGSRGLDLCCQKRKSYQDLTLLFWGFLSQVHMFLGNQCVVCCRPDAGGTSWEVNIWLLNVTNIKNHILWPPWSSGKKQNSLTQLPNECHGTRPGSAGRQSQ